MAVRLGSVLLLLALALVAESSLTYDTAVDVHAASAASGTSTNEYGLRTCNGLVGECINDEEEMMMDSEASRRVLYQSRYIGYAAMRANRIPCSRRGASYYNCRRHKRMNPYTRGCSRITKCKRIFR